MAGPVTRIGTTNWYSIQGMRVTPMLNWSEMGAHGGVVICNAAGTRGLVVGGSTLLWLLHRSSSFDAFKKNLLSFVMLGTFDPFYNTGAGVTSIPKCMLRYDLSASVVTNSAAELNVALAELTQIWLLPSHTLAMLGAWGNWGALTSSFSAPIMFQQQSFATMPTVGGLKAYGSVSAGALSDMLVDELVLSAIIPFFTDETSIHGYFDKALLESANAGIAKSKMDEKLAPRVATAKANYPDQEIRPWIGLPFLRVGTAHGFAIDPIVYTTGGTPYFPNVGGLTTSGFYVPGFPSVDMTGGATKTTTTAKFEGLQKFGVAESEYSSLVGNLLDGAPTYERISPAALLHRMLDRYSNTIATYTPPTVSAPSGGDINALSLTNVETNAPSQGGSVQIPTWEALLPAGLLGAHAMLSAVVMEKGDLVEIIRTMCPQVQPTKSSANLPYPDRWTARLNSVDLITQHHQTLARAYITGEGLPLLPN